MAINSYTVKEIEVQRIVGFEGSERGEYHMHYEVTQKFVSHAGEGFAKIGDYYYQLDDLKDLIEELEIFQKQLDVDTRESVTEQ